MKTITKKPAKKSIKKTVKTAAKVSKVSKVAAPVAKAQAATMKFENLDQLATHIARRLPWARQSSKIRHLRNIKLDPASMGNGVIIWYGCKSTMNVIDFHINRNLEISYHGIDLNKEDADIIIAEIGKLLKGNCFNAKANVMLIGNCFAPTLPSLPQVKSESAPAATSEIIINPEGLAVLAAPDTEAEANAELVEADTDSMPKA